MDISGQEKGGNHVHEESWVEAVEDNHISKEDTGVLQEEQEGAEHHPQ